MDDSGCATKWRRAAVRRALGTSRTEDQAVRAGGGESDGGVGKVAGLCQRAGGTRDDGNAMRFATMLTRAACDQRTSVRVREASVDAVTA